MEHTIYLYAKEIENISLLCLLTLAGRGGGEGWGGGVDAWTDEQAQTNLPLQLLRSWGQNNALMYNVCKLCP